jgi:DnaJ-class molecular chaperone
MIDTILYDKLDISPGLSDDEIRKVGKKLLLKYHPDKNENKEESSKKFIEIKEILDILTDKEKRELYHKIGISILNNNLGNNSNINPEHVNNINNFNNSQFFQNFTSFFNNFTKMTGDFSIPGIPGMSMPSMPSIPGIIPGVSTFNNKNYNSDITYTIKINRLFLRQENEYNVYYKRIIVCKECENSKICEKCDGKRFIENKIVLNNIIMRQRILCDLCKDNLCKKCNGNEYIEDNKKVILNIKGDKIIELIDNKQTIILRENGNVLKDKITDLVIIFSD